MYTIKLDTSVGKIYGYMILLGVGGGMYAQASFAVAQAKAKPDEIPVATAFISLAQLTGGTIALAISNAVFLEKATQGILRAVPGTPMNEVQSAINAASSTFFQSLDQQDRQAVLRAVTDAISKVYILPITGAALSFALSFFMPREKVRPFNRLDEHVGKTLTCDPNSFSKSSTLAESVLARKSVSYSRGQGCWIWMQPWF